MIGIYGHDYRGWRIEPSRIQGRGWCIYAPEVPDFVWSFADTVEIAKRMIDEEHEAAAQIRAVAADMRRRLFTDTEKEGE